MSKMLRAQMFALTRSLYAWFCTVLLSFLVCVALLSVYRISTEVEPMRATLIFPGVLFHYVFFLNAMFGPVLGLFLCNVALGGDYVWGTVRLPLLQGYPRWQVALAKWLAVGLTMSAASVVSSIAGAATGLLITNWLQAPIGPTSIDVWGRMILTWLLVMGALAVYVAMAGALSTATRSPVLGLSIGLLVFFSEVLLGEVVNIPQTRIVKPYLLFPNVLRLVKPLEGEQFPIWDWGAITVLVIYGVSYLAIMVYIFAKQDIHE